MVLLTCTPLAGLVGLHRSLPFTRFTDWLVYTPRFRLPVYPVTGLFRSTRLQLRCRFTPLVLLPHHPTCYYFYHCLHYWFHLRLRSHRLVLPQFRITTPAAFTLWFLVGSHAVSLPPLVLPDYLDFGSVPCWFAALAFSTLCRSCWLPAPLPIYPTFTFACIRFGHLVYLTPYPATPPFTRAAF